MHPNTFLLEIGCEELPAQSLKKLAENFEACICHALQQASVPFDDIRLLYTPRRLAIICSNVAAKQQEQTQIIKGPSLSIALDTNQQPTAAGLGFAQKCGIDATELTTLIDDKTSRLLFKKTRPGQKTFDLLPQLVQNAINKWHIPNTMRWQDGVAPFPRPVRWITALYGADIVPLTLFGCQSDRITFGLRTFSTHPLHLQHASDYLTQLHTACVMADANERRQHIVKGLHEQTPNTLQCQHTAAQIDSVCHLTEWPEVVRGNIDARYLNLPIEVLESVIRIHQKSFIITKDNQPQPYFITIANGYSQHPEHRLQGYENVIEARLSDAYFFFKQDLETPLSNLSERLSQILFAEKLGSMKDKCRRIASLAITLSQALPDATQRIIEQAASLCKADLMSASVTELPELTGTIGYYLALHQNHPVQLAEGLRDHYLPLSPQHPIAPSVCGQLLAIADKVDTLVGFFAIGQKPTADKDPLALRRTALGIVRTLIEGEHHHDLVSLIEHSYEIYCHSPASMKNFHKNSECIQSVYQFILDRLYGWYVDQGINKSFANAMIRAKPRDLYDQHRRLGALIEFSQQSQFQTLHAAHHRIWQILRKQDAINPDQVIKPSLCTHPAEQNLLNQLEHINMACEPLITSKQYLQAVLQLIALNDPIDQFFTDLHVLCDDETIRNNRLALLNKAHKIMTKVIKINDIN